MNVPSSPGRVLVVEDKESLRLMLEEALRGEGYAVVAAAAAEEAFERLDEEAFDLVLTDLKLPGADGLEVVTAARETAPPTPVVVMTAYGSVRRAVEAMRRGALDFLEKPVELDALFQLVESVVAGRAPEAVFEIAGVPPIVGGHAHLQAALRLLQKVAPTESTILLTGESGTGKELFARAAHALSPRHDGPFVALNCAAIPETLIENELFGHEKGAFTGADRRQAGRFEQAAGGTLFLDEIGELPLAVQSKVLRVLEERSFERVGSGTTLQADVRLVVATNRDLRTMVQDRTFRADLFYRLEVFPIDLPPLRERPEDIPQLARYLADRLAQRHGVEPVRLDESALQYLAGRPWPGNVRELSNLLERATIVDPGALWSTENLRRLAGDAGPADEVEALRQALLEADGDKHMAAERLGISYRTLQRRIKKHDLEGFPEYRD